MLDYLKGRQWLPLISDAGHHLPGLHYTFNLELSLADKDL